ncbi:MAG: TRAP transporter substrate-binding protein DctP, partial [Reyranella sp.]|nr:TRAP transporter substrate-binding protein DctP [Reyranella sp.]
LETQGLIGLCFYDTGPRSFYTSKKPIRNVADLKDMSVRVQSSDILSLLLQSIGATPKAIPFGRVYDSLRSGAVDAAEFDFQTYEYARHHEVAKFYSMTEHSMAPSVLVFSKKIWDRLPADDRLIIAAAARESVPYMRSLNDEYEPMARKAVEAAGAEIITDVDKASFSDALVPAYARFVRDPKLRDMVKRIKATDSLRTTR